MQRLEESLESECRCEFDLVGDRYEQEKLCWFGVAVRDIVYWIIKEEKGIHSLYRV